MSRKRFPDFANYRRGGGDKGCIG
ncbi:hypothetical protein [Acutalibacter muris]